MKGLPHALHPRLSNVLGGQEDNLIWNDTARKEVEELIVEVLEEYLGFDDLSDDAVAENDVSMDDPFADSDASMDDSVAESDTSIGDL